MQRKVSKSLKDPNDYLKIQIKAHNVYNKLTINYAFTSKTLVKRIN